VHFVDHVVVGNYKIWILIFGIHIYLRKNVAVASDLAILRVILLLIIIIIIIIIVINRQLLPLVLNIRKNLLFRFIE
jgi:hypothetical protein